MHGPPVTRLKEANHLANSRDKPCKVLPSKGLRTRYEGNGKVWNRLNGLRICAQSSPYPHHWEIPFKSDMFCKA